MKRLSYKVEPKLHLHRYICAIYVGKITCYKFCANRNEVRDLKTKLKKGQILEVFSADHNFENAWQA